MIAAIVKTVLLVLAGIGAVALLVSLIVHGSLSREGILALLACCAVVWVCR